MHKRVASMIYKKLRKESYQDKDIHSESNEPSIDLQKNEEIKNSSEDNMDGNRENFKRIVSTRISHEFKKSFNKSIRNNAKSFKYY